MTIVPGEYKSQVGLDKLHYAIVSKDDATAYTAGEPAFLAPAGTAKTSSSTSIQIQYADDGVFDSSSDEGETKVEIEVTNVPLSLAALLTGKTYNTTNGMFIDGSAGNAPECALSFRSLKSNGKYRYIQYLKGKFSLADEDFETKKETKDPKSAKLIFTAMRTNYQFTTATGVKENVKRVMVDEDVVASATLITNWFSAVQVPVAPSP